MIFLFLILIPGICYSQDTAKKTSHGKVKQVDIKDLLRELFNKKPKPADSVALLKAQKKISFTVLPGISYNPANGIIIGVSTSLSKNYGDPKNTKLSFVSTGLVYTTKNQIKLSLQSSIFSSRNDWSFQGDWRLWKYTQNTYGLGTQSVPANAQNMTFYFVRFNENVLKKVAHNFYAGLGFSLEYYYNLTTIDSSDNFLYPNYNNTYSSQNGYDSSNYVSSGLVLNLDYDSRDNTNNAYKGILADIKYFNYKKFFGSSQDWESLSYEFRGFKSLTKSDSYILAFWTLGVFEISGTGPYMTLPANGWDKYNTTGRGYIQGRFRGNNYMYAEFENRIRLTSNGLFGMAFFINVETASNKAGGIKLLDYIEPAGGVGLRIKFDKGARTNLCIDFAFGRYGSTGLFLNIGEFF